MRKGLQIAATAKIDKNNFGENYLINPATVHISRTGGNGLFCICTELSQRYVLNPSGQPVTYQFITLSWAGCSVPGVTS